MVGIGILSAFNKGLSEGVFGPVVTSGQILAGQRHKGAIGVTTLAEAPICIIGFFTYLIGRSIGEFNGSVMSVPVSEFFSKMFSLKMFQWELVLALTPAKIKIIRDNPLPITLMPGTEVFMKSWEDLYSRLDIRRF